MFLEFSIYCMSYSVTNKTPPHCHTHSILRLLFVSQDMVARTKINKFGHIRSKVLVWCLSPLLGALCFASSCDVSGSWVLRNTDVKTDVLLITNFRAWYRSSNVFILCSKGVSHKDQLHHSVWRICSCILWIGLFLNYRRGIISVLLGWVIVDTI